MIEKPKANGPCVEHGGFFVSYRICTCCKEADKHKSRYFIFDTNDKIVARRDTWDGVIRFMESKE